MSTDSETNLKLLLVGYHFMRTHAAGSHRLHAMVKYLARKGWTVTVLTVRKDGKKSGDTHENSALGYVSAETRIIETSSLELKWMWTGLTTGTTVARQATPVGGKSSLSTQAARRGRAVDTWWKTPARWVRGILSFPDRQNGWLLPLMFWSWRLLRRHKFDVVLTSGPPHSCHLPFVILKKLFPFIWVCDFRDPWSDPPFYALNGASLSTRRIPLFINRKLEGAVLRNCDRVLANTMGNEDALQRRFGRFVRNKVTVLTNGYDEEVEGSRGNLDESSLESDFVFTGAMYRWMLTVYLEALKYLRDTGQRLPRLHIFGRTDSDLRHKCREYGVEDSVVFKGVVSYEESLWLMSRAKALLLLFVSHHEIFRCSVPSKLYAYLSARRPYLALVPEGDTARILGEVGGGVVVKSSEPSEVAAAITSFVESLNAGTLRVEFNERALTRYSWPNLSSRLDDLMRGDVERKRKSEQRLSG